MKLLYLFALHFGVLAKWAYFNQDEEGIIPISSLPQLMYVDVVENGEGSWLFFWLIKWFLFKKKK